MQAKGKALRSAEAATRRRTVRSPPALPLLISAGVTPKDMGSWKPDLVSFRSVRFDAPHPVLDALEPPLDRHLGAQCEVSIFQLG